ncbi:HAD-IIIA family hydrolase [bacterium]|nr:HAD-IIIA family hydrolase [bacterium]
MEEIEEIHRRMRADIEAAGGRLLDVLFCPHWEHDKCACRKPRPGMFFTAAGRHHIDLAGSIYVGDRLLDLEAARAAGCKFVFVGTESLPAAVTPPEHCAESLLAAVPWILAQLPGPWRTA